MTHKKIEVQIVNAFVDGKQGGNPAGVVLDADHLSVQQKLEIAKQVGHSETAFVSNSHTADFKVEFFTPTRQIAHCGHATIATFSYLSQSGKILGADTSKETIDGIRAIKLMDGLVFMEQIAPRYESVLSFHDEILKSLSISEENLIATLDPMLVNTGNSLLIIPLKNGDVLKNLKPDFSLIEKISKKLDMVGYYLYTTQTSQPQRDASTRMFAPLFGIKEESATGMAAGTLACYLYDMAGLKKKKFLIEQGHHMIPQSPGLIQINLMLENDNILKLMAGGMGEVREKKIVEV